MPGFVLHFLSNSKKTYDKEGRKRAQEDEVLYPSPLG